MADQAPYPTLPDGTPDWAHMTPDQVKAAGAALGSGTAQPTSAVGMATGTKAVGLHTATGVGPGLERIPGNVSPAERGVTYTQYGTKPTTTMYQAQDILSPGSAPTPDVIDLQNRLIQAGLLDPNKVRAGVWDAASQNAYKVVLAFANQHAMNKVDALNVFLANPINQSANQLAPTRTANTMDIASAVSGPGSNVATQMLGQNLSAGETKDFTDWYQQQEAQARDSYMQADLTGKGTSPDAPSVTAAAQEYIKQHNLSQSVAYGTASRMFHFYDLLKGVV